MNSQVQLITPYHMHEYDARITAIYQNLSAKSSANIADRIVLISQCFLGQPYLGGALGEGSGGRFDQNPIYRTDGFDCLTLVNTVLALALSQSLSEFQNKMFQLNYYDAEHKYQNTFKWGPICLH